MVKNPYGFVLTIAIIAFVLHFFVPWMTASTIIALVAMPIAEALGFHPFIPVLVALIAGDHTIVPYVNSGYAIVYFASEGELFTHEQARWPLVIESLLRPVALLLERTGVAADGAHVKPDPSRGGHPMTDRIDQATRQDVRADRPPVRRLRRGARAYARVPTISAPGSRGRGRRGHAPRAPRRPARLMDVPGGPPLVVGEVAASSGPPLILYNHYDVQPVDPLEQWRRAPFDPVVEDGKLFARGVADTKGNTAAQASRRPRSARSWAAAGEPPVHGGGRGGGREPSSARLRAPASRSLQGGRRNDRGRGARRRASPRSTWAARGSSTSS